MKRRTLLVSLTVVVVLILAIFMVACDDGTITTTALTKEMVSLEYDTIEYTGLELKPAVTIKIDTVEVPAENYTIAYADNTNVGTAKVTVTAKEDSILISGSVEITFSITVKSTHVTTAAELVAAAKTDAKIVLDNDITNNYEDINISTIDSTRDLEFVLDLNGYDILAELNIKTWGKNAEKTATVYYEHSIKCTIMDSSAEKTSSIGANNENVWYGIMINGGASDEHEASDIDVTINDVDFVGYYGGIYTNGSCKGATISVSNSVCTGEITAEDSVGAYLAAGYEYNFTNCKFSGGTGLYTKSGDHSYTNCEFVASAEYTGPVYNGNGADITGSAFVADSAVGYVPSLTIELNNSKFVSAHGYGIEECSTAKTEAAKVCYAEITVDANSTYEVIDADHNVISQNDVVTIA